MRSFEHINARTVKEACVLLRRHEGKAVLNAGGTDLLSILKSENLPEYPEILINIKTVRNLGCIAALRGGVRIGALTKLSDIVASPLIRERYPVLAQAAKSVATTQIRNAGTIGGNLCQHVRCAYYRYSRHIGGPIACARKGKGACPAVTGDNRYHAITQAKKCFAVCPSDTAVALAALDARIVIAGSNGKRKASIVDFYQPMRLNLAQDEMITHVEIPRLNEKTKQRFIKFTLSKPGDFAIVSVASVIAETDGLCKDARIALGAVAPGPLRVTKTEEMIAGKSIDEKIAAKAAELALSGLKPLSKNAYKVEIAKTLLKRAIL